MNLLQLSAETDRNLFKTLHKIFFRQTILLDTDWTNQISNNNIILQTQDLS